MVFIYDEISQKETIYLMQLVLECEQPNMFLSQSTMKEAIVNFMLTGFSNEPESRRISVELCLVCTRRILRP